MSRELSNVSAKPIENLDDLLHVFHQGSRPRQDFMVGVETEKIGVEAKTNKAVKYEGPCGIQAVLEGLSREFGWQPVFDQGKIIALNKDSAAITLEPGGQLELSGRQNSCLKEIDDELSGHRHELVAVSEPLSVHWHDLGVQPVTRLEEMSWVPRSRYKIMRSYYESRSSQAALEMMSLTASTQVNLDYIDECDARKKIHLGAVLGPVVGAMLANACVEGGVLNGYCSRRLFIWRKTDPDRCGVPRFFVDGSFSFEKYRDYALDIPMYFLVRQGQYIKQTRQTFRRFLETSQKNDLATCGDWERHLTTLFPDVRLKNHLEVRTADANPPGLTLSIIAFWMGLMYDNDALDAAYHRILRFKQQEIIQAMDCAAISGLKSNYGCESILSVARDLVSISAVGLSRLDKESGHHEIRFLEPLRELVERGVSPAEEVRKTWNGDITELLKQTQVQ